MSRWHKYPDEIPESSCKLLVQDKFDEIMLIPYSDKYKSFNVSDEDDDTELNINEYVLAWMELPEKYKRNRATARECVWLSIK